MHSCVFCPSVFEKKQALERHESREHNIPWYFGRHLCIPCNKALDCLKRLNSHFDTSQHKRQIAFTAQFGIQTVDIPSKRAKFIKEREAGSCPKQVVDRFKELSAFPFITNLDIAVRPSLVSPIDDVVDILATMQMPVLDEVCNSGFEAVTPVSVSPQDTSLFTLSTCSMPDTSSTYYVYNSDRQQSPCATQCPCELHCRTGS